MPRHRISLGSVLSTAALLAIGVRMAPAGDRTDDVLERLALRRGIVVVLGDSRCELALDIARRSELLVYSQLPDARAVESVRREALAAGLDATRFQVDVGRPDRVHLADDVAGALVAVGEAETLDETEALRVLSPRGRALLGERLVVKPVPEGMDDWSHPYHGPDNNPLSRDRLIRAPYATQFLADPRYAPAPQVAVAAGGRVFKAFGHVAWHEREEPFLNTLVAFDGFNGTLLWKRALPKGYMVHRNTIVATADTLYLADDTSCKLIDAASGEVRREIRPPEDVAGGSFWKWLALEGDVLYALIGAQELADPTMRWKRKAHGWPWNRISKGYNQPEHPWGFGRTLLAMHRRTGEVLWRHREDEPADARAVCMGGGRLFLFRFGEYLTCLDSKSGEVRWRRTKEKDPELFAALGGYLPRQGWQTNWRTAVYLKCSDKALYFAGPQMSKLLAVSAEDGRILWEDPYDNFQLIIRDDGLFAISGPWGNNQSKKFDPLTGDVLATLPTGRRACTRPTGTTDSILFRAMGGSVRFDVASSRPCWISPMRPQCQDGVTIANGRLYWWPYTCDCQLSLYGVISLVAARDERRPSPAASALETPEDAPEVSESRSGAPADWPTFRGNNTRTATSRASVSRRAETLWTARDGRRSPGLARPTAPVAAEGMVLLADADGVVRAHDAASGREKWTAHTGGEIRFPPTVWRGRAYVGSGDGWVYAFESASGRLLWRFRAAPRERKIPVYGRLLSTWPAASGVLVSGGVAYVAAGIVNYDGTHVYALDARTGKVRWRNDTSGHLDPVARTGVSVQGHLLLHDGRLYLAGGNAVSPAVYDVRDGRCLNDAAALARCESTSPRGWELFLMGDRVITCGRPLYSRPQDPVYDHTVTKKVLHASTGERDVIWLDQRLVAGYEPLRSEWLSRCVTDEERPRHITQAWGTFRVPAKADWQRETRGGIALAVARNAVVVATASDVRALSIEDGEELWSAPLTAAPVPWGIAIDRHGRVVVALVDGTLLALGRR
ncbi:MAG: PQQ-binding-like beta-propeller repeat protein [Planctomycetota bacterium]|nr:PQQ-binding-like beta-propeller repeat protein [Planctomycetota bacterium]